MIATSYLREDDIFLQQARDPDTRAAMLQKLRRTRAQRGWALVALIVLSVALSFTEFGGVVPLCVAAVVLVSYLDADTVIKATNVAIALMEGAGPRGDA